MPDLAQATEVIVERGMFGYYIGLADDQGPLGRLEDVNYPTWEIAAENAEEIAIIEGLKFIGRKRI